MSVTKNYFFSMDTWRHLSPSFTLYRGVFFPILSIQTKFNNQIEKKNKKSEYILSN